MKRTLCSLAVVGLVGLAGCYVYNPYWYPGSPYGTPPGVAPQPGMTVPQGSLVGPPAVSMGQPQTLPAPANSAQSGQWQQVQPAQPGQNNQVEAFRPGTSNDRPADVLVPQPRDPGERRPAKPNGPPGTSPDNPFGFNQPSPQVELQGIQGLSDASDSAASGPILTQRVALHSGSVERAVEATSDDFVPPTPVRQVSQTSVDSSQPQPFGYDRQAYTWLRGVVDYDENEGAWHLMYSLKPSPDDPYGGDLTLADHPDLAKLKDGDVVLVEGRLDPHLLDSLGKPRYRIEKLVGPLSPKR